MTMDKTFDPAAAEPRIYAEWEAAGAFRAGANAKPDAQSFCIVIPPPNVTGSLHIGHALNNTLQDILIRWKRMQGYDVLWQPGQDHAGIATQMVVERDLAAAGGESRREMGRARFIDKVWEWKEQSGGAITGQLKRLGASCDWSRERFTMDEGLSEAVLKVFVDLYEKGLIYRGKRLVNWDPKFETAISDLEVENVETDGQMWHFKYPLAGGETYEYVEKDEDGAETFRETRDYISIATTRPETMLGDGAVAVHPSDARYASIVGTLCEIPVGPKSHRRLIPIISDDYPDPDFGSGAVKITGAHDFNDYGVAKRNRIPCYRLMDTKAAMRADGAPYAEAAAEAKAIVEGAERSEAEIDAINLVPDDLRGLDRFEARARVVEQITDEGLAVMVPASDPRLAGAAKTPAAPEEGGEDRTTTLTPLVEPKNVVQPFGDRSKVVIEPMLTDQWFVDAETLAKPALAAVKDGRTRFAPEAWEKTYFHWLEEIQPWCISRQLWWGHQIPVWYGPDGAQFCAENYELAVEAAEAHYQSLNENGALDDALGSLSSEPAYFQRVSVFATDDDSAKDKDGRSQPTPSEMVAISGIEDGGYAEIDIFISRDPDVLDTWFSSALWPFSTLGWPEETDELQRYYKTDVLITGNDIIFFWVARMMMTALEFLGEEPFHTVYINSIVTDAKGKKMSKSVGNVIDPLELIDEYGADALRFTLASQEVQGKRQLRLAREQVEQGRNFGTKLWNAARFAEMNDCAFDEDFDPAEVSQIVNRWILAETAQTLGAVDDALGAYRFNDAANALYAHVWRVFCDWYVEFAKPLLQGEDEEAKAETRATMAWALDQCIIMLHPITPFITEELWAASGPRAKPLIHADWPDYGPELARPSATAEMTWVIGLIEEIRSFRVEMGVPAGAEIVVGIGEITDPLVPDRITKNCILIQRLSRTTIDTDEMFVLPQLETQHDKAKLMDHQFTGAVTLPVTGCNLYMFLDGVIDAPAEKARLEKTLDKLRRDKSGVAAKLANEKFLANARPEVVEEQRERFEGIEAEEAKLEAALLRLADLA